MFFNGSRMKVGLETKRGGLRLASLCIILTLCAGFVHAQRPDDVKKALRLIDIEQPTKGLALMDQTVKANASAENAAAYWYYLGLAQIRTGSLDQALTSFDKGIALNEKEPLNYAGKGHVKLLQKNPTEAKPLLDKASSLAKAKNIEAQKAISEAYLADSKFLLEAIQILNKAKSAASEDADVFILLGDAYLAQNNGGASVSAYEDAARADAKNGKAHYKIGMVYQRSKNNAVAVEAFDKAVAADPEFAPAYKELGEIYYSMKEGAKAAKAQESYLKITEKPESGRMKLAFYYFMAKEYAKANDIFKELSTKPNPSPVLLRFYAKSLMEVKDTTSSRRIFDQYFTVVKPEEVEAGDYKAYGGLLELMKDDSLAIQAYQKSLAIEPNQVDVLQNVAEGEFKLKHYKESADAYKSLMAKRPRVLSQDYYNIGRSYYYSEQFAAADSAFTKLIELQPNMTVGYLWSGRSKAQLDPETETGLAKPVYEKLIEKAQVNPEKSKNELIEAYRYLGSYYYSNKQDIAQSKTYWEKVLALDPKNQQAQDVLKQMKAQK